MKAGIKAIDVYLALGSNLGERETNINEAIKMLSMRLEPVKVSTLYETEPEGGAEQPLYLNQAAQFRTTLQPMTLLTLVKGIEVKMGRNTPTGTPRVIDIDIVFYGNEVVNTTDLVIPHPRLTSRAFVLVPLLEIAPDFVHPVEHKTVRELFWALKDKKGVRRWNRSDL